MGQLVDCFEAGSDIDKVSVTLGRCLSVSLSIRTMKQSSGDWHLNIPDTQTQWTWTPGRYTGDTSTAVKLIHINNNLNCVDIYLSTDAGCFPLDPWSKLSTKHPASMAVSLHLDCPSRVIPTVLATIRLIITINSTRLHSARGWTLHCTRRVLRFAEMFVLEWFLKDNIELIEGKHQKLRKQTTRQVANYQLPHICCGRQDNLRCMY